MRTLLNPVLSLVILILCSSITPIRSFNITKILAQHPDFSTFNHYLSVTHLAGEINRRKTITVLTISNSGMSSILSKHLSLYTLRNLLSLHVLVDYFGAKQLHQLNRGTTLSSTLFQATGAAPGTTGFVNITLHRAGRVFFSATDSGGNPPVSFVKSLKEIPYFISVIQISSPLSSPEAEAPTPAPTDVNITDLMAKNGCKTFSDLLDSTADAAASLSSNAGSGLSAFCPVDQAINPFLPLFKNLTTADKLSVLLYHAIPVYYSIQMLKSNNHVMTTLATEGAKKNYNLTVRNDGEVVTLKTRVDTAKITGTLIDEDPLAVYTIDVVLKPRELFKPVEAPAPAPAPAPTTDAVADSPKRAKKQHKHALPPPAAAEPADSPDDEPADLKVDDDQSGAVGGRLLGVTRVWIAVAAVLVFANRE